MSQVSGRRPCSTSSCGPSATRTVLRTQGLEVEAPLAFAALHRLLRPLMRLREQLPAPQARALRVAFGEEDGPSVEPFLVAIATLSLLTAAAEERLVLCLVDDAHWLDPATADALLFCARRLAADRVLMVFAARDGAERPFRPDGLAELVLTGLDPEAARALLDERLGAAPPDGGRRPAGGGDAAATRWRCSSCPPSSAPTQLGGASPLPAQLHLTDRVEQVFLDRSRRLPPRCSSCCSWRLPRTPATSPCVRAAAPTSGRTSSALEAADGLRAARRPTAWRAGAPPAGAFGGLPGRDRRAATTRPPRAGRRPGRARRP